MIYSRINEIRYTIYTSCETISVKYCYARFRNSENSRAFRHSRRSSCTSNFIYRTCWEGRKGLWFISTLFQNDATSGASYYTAVSHRTYPTLICITIMVSPIEHSGRRPALCRDSRPLNRDAAISQPQKRLQINVTFLRALIWTPAMSLIPLAHPFLFPGERIQLSCLLFHNCIYFFISKGEWTIYFYSCTLLRF